MQRARRPLAALLFSILHFGAIQAAVAQDEQRKPITDEGATYLVRSTLIALSQANETGNYTVLRDLGAPSFRDTNDAARLAAIFVSLRESETDLSYTALAEPVFAGKPRLTNEDMLHLAGTVPGGSPTIAFEFLFQPIDGRWRLFGLAVNDAGARNIPGTSEDTEPSQGSEEIEPSSNSSRE